MSWRKRVLGRIASAKTQGTRAWQVEGLGSAARIHGAIRKGYRMSYEE